MVQGSRLTIVGRGNFTLTQQAKAHVMGAALVSDDIQCMMMLPKVGGEPCEHDRLKRNRRLQALLVESKISGGQY